MYNPDFRLNRTDWKVRVPSYTYNSYMHNPFWSDFIKSVKTLFKTDIITHMDVIHEVPIWFNPNIAH